MNTLTADDIEEENYWLQRMIIAAELFDKVEYYLKWLGGGEYEIVVNHYTKVPMEIHYFHTQEEAQAHLVERYPDAKWEETGWAD